MMAADSTYSPRFTASQSQAARKPSLSLDTNISVGHEGRVSCPYENEATAEMPIMPSDYFFDVLYTEPDYKPTSYFEDRETTSPQSLSPSSGLGGSSFYSPVAQPNMEAASAPLLSFNCTDDCKPGSAVSSYCATSSSDPVSDRAISLSGESLNDSRVSPTSSIFTNSPVGGWEPSDERILPVSHQPPTSYGGYTSSQVYQPYRPSELSQIPGSQSQAPISTAPAYQRKPWMSPADIGTLNSGSVNDSR